MSKNLILGIVVIVIAVFLIATALIMKIIAKKGKLVDEHDFITDALDNKKQQFLKMKSGISVGMYITMMVIFPIIIWVAIYLIMKNIFFASMFAVAGLYIPNIIVAMSQNKGAQKFDERFAKALSQLSASLRAGLTIPQAIEEISASPYIYEDIRNEFAQMNAGLKLNKSISKVFEELAVRIDNDDAKDLAAAIKLQSMIGGKEAESVATVAKNITDRIAERKKIKTMFSETSTTVLLMDILPFAIIAFLFVGASSFMNFYTESIKGMVMFGAIIIYMIIGSVITRLMLNKGGNVK